MREIDLSVYERDIRKHPELIKKYDLNNPAQLKIVHNAIQKINRSPNREREFKSQLVRLSVKPNTLREWMTMDMMQYDEPRDDILYLERKKKRKSKKSVKRCGCK